MHKVPTHPKWCSPVDCHAPEGAHRGRPRTVPLGDSPLSTQGVVQLWQLHNQPVRIRLALGDLTGVVPVILSLPQAGILARALRELVDQGKQR